MIEHKVDIRTGIAEEPFHGPLGGPWNGLRGSVNAFMNFSTTVSNYLRKDNMDAKFNSQYDITMYNCISTIRYSVTKCRFVAEAAHGSE